MKNKSLYTGRVNSVIAYTWFEGAWWCGFSITTLKLNHFEGLHEIYLTEQEALNAVKPKAIKFLREVSKKPKYQDIAIYLITQLEGK